MKHPTTQMPILAHSPAEPQIDYFVAAAIEETDPIPQG
jgi:hypothetical protein